MNKPLLVLAPMATLSHRALRETISHYGGCDLFFTEMANAGSLVSGSHFEDCYLDPLPFPDRTVIQLVSGETADFLRAAAFLKQRAGEGRGFAGVDLNMGCSAPELLRCGAGAAWLSRRDEAIDLVRRMREALPGSRLSAKLRLIPGDEGPALLEHCARLAEAGLDALTLHPRYPNEKYGRPPRWKQVRDVAAALSIPVFGNGDIDSAETYLKREAEAPCAGYMIGRAAAKKPWVFAEIARAKDRAAGAPDAGTAPVKVDLLEAADLYCRGVETYLPREFWRSRTRRFFFHYFENFKFGHQGKFATQLKDTPAECLAVLEEYFLGCPEEREREI